MNNENELDRFHTENEICKENAEPFMVKYSPECFLKPKTNFTTDKDYEVIESVLERSTNFYKLRDDNNQIVVISDDYFIPSSVQSRLVYENEMSEYRIDIRDETKEICSKSLKEMFSENCWGHLLDESVFKRDNLNFNRDGEIKDSIPEILNDPDKCMAAISKVFGDNQFSNPDEFIFEIKKKFPEANIHWNNGFLTFNCAKTKIAYQDVQFAYTSLLKFSSPRVSVKAIAKIIVSKLKKLF